MRQRLVLLLLLGLIIAILIVMARQGGGAIAPLSSRDFSSLGYKIALLVFVSGAVLTLFRERLTEAITAALLWVVVGLFLVIGYSYRLQLHDIADRVMVVLVPGHVFTHGRDAEIYRSASSSDFYIREVQINEALVPMVLDTGASTIVLTQEDAKAAGLPLALLDYTVSIDTANGRTHAAPLKIKVIAIGDIEEHSVDALVAQAGTLRTSLLGMSFLNRLQSWEVRGTTSSCTDTRDPRCRGSSQIRLTKNRADTSRRKQLNVISSVRRDSGMGEPRAVRRRQARHGRHHREPNQRDEAKGERRQQRMMR